MDGILDPVAIKHLSQLDKLKEIIEHFASLKALGVEFECFPLKMMLGGIYYVLNQTVEGKISLEIDTSRNQLIFMPIVSHPSNSNTKPSYSGSGIPSQSSSSYQTPPNRATPDPHLIHNKSYPYPSLNGTEPINRHQIGIAIPHRDSFSQSRNNTPPVNTIYKPSSTNNNANLGGQPSNFTQYVSRQLEAKQLDPRSRSFSNTPASSSQHQSPQPSNFNHMSIQNQLTSISLGPAPPVSYPQLQNQSTNISLETTLPVSYPQIPNQSVSTEPSCRQSIPEDSFSTERQAPTIQNNTPINETPTVSSTVPSGLQNVPQQGANTENVKQEKEEELTPTPVANSEQQTIIAPPEELTFRKIFETEKDNPSSIPDSRIPDILRLIDNEAFASSTQPTNSNNQSPQTIKSGLVSTPGSEKAISENNISGIPSRNPTTPVSSRSCKTPTKDLRSDSLFDVVPSVNEALSRETTVQPADTIPSRTTLLNDNVEQDSLGMDFVASPSDLNLFDDEIRTPLKIDLNRSTSNSERPLPDKTPSHTNAPKSKKSTTISKPIVSIKQEPLDPLLSNQSTKSSSVNQPLSPKIKREENNINVSSLKGKDNHRLAVKKEVTETPLGPPLPSSSTHVTPVEQSRTSLNRPTLVVPPILKKIRPVVTRVSDKDNEASCKESSAFYDSSSPPDVPSNISTNDTTKTSRLEKPATVSTDKISLPPNLPGKNPSDTSGSLNKDTQKSTSLPNQINTTNDEINVSAPTNNLNSSNVPAASPAQGISMRASETRDELVSNNSTAPDFFELPHLWPDHTSPADSPPSLGDRSDVRNPGDEPNVESSGEDFAPLKFTPRSRNTIVTSSDDDESKTSTPRNSRSFSKTTKSVNDMTRLNLSPKRPSTSTTTAKSTNSGNPHSLPSKAPVKTSQIKGRLDVSSKPPFNRNYGDRTVSPPTPEPISRSPRRKRTRRFEVSSSSGSDDQSSHSSDSFLPRRAVDPLPSSKTGYASKKPKTPSQTSVIDLTGPSDDIEQYRNRGYQGKQPAQGYSKSNSGSNTAAATVTRSLKRPLGTRSPIRDPPIDFIDNSKKPKATHNLSHAPTTRQQPSNPTRASSLSDLPDRRVPKTPINSGPKPNNYSNKSPLQHRNQDITDRVPGLPATKSQKLAAKSYGNSSPYPTAIPNSATTTQAQRLPGILKKSRDHDTGDLHRSHDINKTSSTTREANLADSNMSHSSRRPSHSSTNNNERPSTSRHTRTTVTAADDSRGYYNAYPPHDYHDYDGYSHNKPTRRGSQDSATNKNRPAHPRAGSNPDSSRFSRTQRPEPSTRSAKSPGGPLERNHAFSSRPKSPNPEARSTTDRSNQPCINPFVTNKTREPCTRNESSSTKKTVMQTQASFLSSKPTFLRSFGANKYPSKPEEPTIFKTFGFKSTASARPVAPPLPNFNGDQLSSRSNNLRPAPKTPQHIPPGPERVPSRPAPKTPQYVPFGYEQAQSRPAPKTPQHAPFGSERAQSKPTPKTPQHVPFGYEQSQSRPVPKTPQHIPSGSERVQSRPVPKTPQHAPFGSERAQSRPVPRTPQHIPSRSERVQSRPVPKTPQHVPSGSERTQPNPYLSGLQNEPVSTSSKAPASKALMKDQLVIQANTTLPINHPVTKESSQKDLSRSEYSIPANPFGFLSSSKLPLPVPRQNEPEYSSPDSLTEEDSITKLYPQFYSFLEMCKQNKRNNVAHYSKLPKFSRSSLKQAFDMHWDLYRKIADVSYSVDETLTNHLNYFVSLAYLGFNCRGNKARDRYEQLLETEYADIISRGLRGSPMPYRTTYQYMACIKGAWVVCRFVGPSLYLNSQDLIPINSFVALTGIESGIAEYLKELGYKEEYYNHDWDFKPVGDLKKFI